MEFEDLTEEQKAKARACTTAEEILALARAEGVELSDDHLEEISGGWCEPSRSQCDEVFIPSY